MAQRDQRGLRPHGKLQGNILLAITGTHIACWRVLRREVHLKDAVLQKYTSDRIKDAEKGDICFYSSVYPTLLSQACFLKWLSGCTGSLDV
jgi:hypothetical protein